MQTWSCYYVLLACFSFLVHFSLSASFSSFPLLTVYWLCSICSVLLFFFYFFFSSCFSILISTLFCVMSVVPPCNRLLILCLSLLVSELQSPATQLCVLNHGVKLTRNAAGREHFREQNLATSHLLLVHTQLEQRKWKQHIPERVENSPYAWVSC